MRQVRREVSRYYYFRPKVKPQCARIYATCIMEVTDKEEKSVIWNVYSLVIIFFQQICFSVVFLRRISKPISFPEHTSKWVGNETRIEYFIYITQKCHNEHISAWGLLISASPSIANISFYISQCMFQKGSPALSSLRCLGQSTKRHIWKPHRSSKTNHGIRSHFCPSGSLLSHK